LKIKELFEKWFVPETSTQTRAELTQRLDRNGSKKVDARRLSGKGFFQIEVEPCQVFEDFRSDRFCEPMASL
jgi:hypothetical protein